MSKQSCFQSLLKSFMLLLPVPPVKEGRGIEKKFGECGVTSYLWRIPELLHTIAPVLWSIQMCGVIALVMPGRLYLE